MLYVHHFTLLLLPVLIECSSQQQFNTHCTKVIIGTTIEIAFLAKTAIKSPKMSNWNKVDGIEKHKDLVTLL